jgi:hypothetical protein
VSDYGDGSSGSGLGGFGHAKGIEPGALDEQTEKEPDDSAENDAPVLSDPEGLVAANEDDGDDEARS